MRRRIGLTLLALFIAGLHFGALMFSFASVLAAALVPKAQPPSPLTMAAALILPYPLLPLLRHAPLSVLSRARDATFYAVCAANAMIWGFAIAWAVGRLIGRSRDARISN